MPTPTLDASPGVRRVTLDPAGVTLSGLLIEPEGPPRAAVVALHGGGMSAGYFDGQAHPSTSLLALGASLGYTVLAVDRPGYGHSAAQLPEGATLAEQSAVLHAALDDFAARYDTGAGLFVLAHSYGGKLALTAAADDSRGRWLGIDISGCGHRYAARLDDQSTGRRHGHWTLNWGKLSLYPPNTFRFSTALVKPMPPRERQEAARWSEIFPGVAARVRVPVRLTFAEHETWWHHAEATVADLTARLAAPRVLVDRQPGTGHNISLGWSARAYHLKALAFFEECLAGRASAARAPARV
ncbi:alpha/beta hydrolase [Streptomyces specialis]|uniref:alpha/beta hydrolase n=1 Tax=Streptomyces specialis TaxID=498367 RepID=UPI00099E8C01|nr:alpha/beta fold hydrolase [Streptomyces specialis]